MWGMAYDPEALAELSHQGDYKNMGESKPQSTQWHRTSESPRTKNGVQLYQWICPFCGDETWAQWGQLEDHECEELKRLFPDELPES